jgi:hypothetical protein
MKVDALMVNTAMNKAVEVGLIPDGVRPAQREQMQAVIQAALDAHATLRAFDELNFKTLGDPVAIQRAIESGR